MRERTLAQTQHRRLTSHSRVRPSLKQATLAGISLDLAAGELACDRLLPCPMLRRGAPQRRPIVSVILRWLDLAADLARGRIRRYAPAHVGIARIPVSTLAASTAGHREGEILNQLRQLVHPTKVY